MPKVLTNVYGNGQRDNDTGSGLAAYPFPCTLTAKS